MRTQTPKRAKQQRAYLKTLSLKKTTDAFRCQGCHRPGSQVTLTPSHLIPRSASFALIAESENIHWHCQERCHDLHERKRWFEMKDGLEIMEYLFANCTPMFWKGMFAFEGNRVLWGTVHAE